MLDTTIKVKTDYFDGPLALLLMLIQKEQMSVKELDLTKITKQYLDYLANMKDLNFDIAGDYLFLASTLVLLKSKNAITEEESNKLQDQLGSQSLNITNHAELVRRLEELQHFQKMAEKLWALPKKGTDIFVKPKVNRKEIVNSILTPMDLEKLTMTMVDFIFRQNRKYTVVKRDRLSIKEKLQFLKSFLQVGQKTNFHELLEKDNSKKSSSAHIEEDDNAEEALASAEQAESNIEDNSETSENTESLEAVAEESAENSSEKSDDKSGKEEIDNIVITFISLLELARLSRIQIFQNEDRGNIYVDVVKSLDDFDVTQADGFEEENEGGEAVKSEDLEAAIQEAPVQ